MGFGVIAEQATGYPGYNSVMSRDKATIGKILKDHGYWTSWFGKDHNTPEFEAKLISLAAHATQMPKDSPWAQATPDMLRTFMGVEHFELVPAYSVGAFTVPENDIFAGL